MADTEDAPGEKEQNKAPSPKPDQDDEVAPPLISVGKGMFFYNYPMNIIKTIISHMQHRFIQFEATIINGLTQRSLL